ncbi:MAG: hypothetical protein DMF61_13225 [Blastocatellia bacterium AA13]|nr:MAG: hypothetical protein DMF61_13225 [Blastocatellia bacterium AA13]
MLEMNKLYKNAEFLSNIAIIVVAILLTVVVVKRFIINSPTSAPEMKEVAVGDKLSIPNVSWEKSRRTLIIVLAQGCHFCAESAPFYRRLTEEVKKPGDVRFMALLPQSRTEGQKYLSDLGIPIQDIEQADLGSINVRGTPTLILVDNSGIVTASWVGKLEPDKEADVINKLQCENCGS